MDDQVVPIPGVRVVHMWKMMNCAKGTIVKDFGEFARVKWDDESLGETSEDYSVIAPLELFPELEDRIANA